MFVDSAAARFVATVEHDEVLGTQIVEDLPRSRKISPVEVFCLTLERVKC